MISIMAQSRALKIPKVGDTIYVESHLYLSRGQDDVIGGKAEVVAVTMQTSGGQPAPFVEVKEHPGRKYNWLYLYEKQEELRERFKGERACEDPDMDPEANRWD